METTYWKQNAVYQIYPRSFCDSNGDGIGDIPGIISKLDYLRDLGIGIIWLSPLYKSPNSDLGYDISDYEGINPEYGTLADMDNFIAEAKKRGIRLIMDLVVNHTSDEHRWFIASKDPTSKYRAYYYWRKGRKNNRRPPNNWTSMFGGPAWTYVPEVGLWYLHLYGPKQPDLDWHSPDVVAEVEGLLRFWLDRGIYGFRCDVINQIWKESLDDGKGFPFQGRGVEHYLMKDGNHVILRKLYDDVFSHYDCMTVGETWKVDYLNASRFMDKELNMVFEFDHTSVDHYALPFFLRKYRPAKMKKVLLGWQENAKWNANYFENHDQPRSIGRFGDPKNHFKESGKMLATLLLTLSGTPYIYEGEEIGMLSLPVESYGQYQDLSAKNVYNILHKTLHLSTHLCEKLVSNFNRDNARSPVQWDASASAGFTAGRPWVMVNPNYPQINVAQQEKDPDSILAFYKRAIALRKENLPLSYGSFNYIHSCGDLFLYSRNYENQHVLVLINLSKKRRKLPKAQRYISGTLLLSNYPDSSLADLTDLRPYESLVIAL